MAAAGVVVVVVVGPRGGTGMGRAAGELVIARTASGKAALLLVGAG